MPSMNPSLCPRDCAGRGLEWQALLGEPLFHDADNCGSATLSHTIDIFVERHHLLWKVPQQLEGGLTAVPAASEAGLWCRPGLEDGFAGFRDSRPAAWLTNLPTLFDASRVPASSIEGTSSVAHSLRKARSLC